MNNPEDSNLEENHEPTQDSEQLREELSKLAEKLETDENVEKLAGILEKEWANPDSATSSRDLSFTKFQEKRKASENQ